MVRSADKGSEVQYAGRVCGALVDMPIYAPACVKKEEGETVEKVKYIKIEVGQAPKRRWVSLWTWLAKLNGWAVAWYAFLAVAGVLLYKPCAAYALRERGYFAVGGEALALLLPALCYCAAATVRDIIEDWRGRH